MDAPPFLAQPYTLLYGILEVYAMSILLFYNVQHAIHINPQNVLLFRNSLQSGSLNYFFDPTSLKQPILIIIYGSSLRISRPTPEITALLNDAFLLFQVHLANTDSARSLHSTT